MRKEDIQIGAWIIWDGDTYPHPRQIIKKDKSGWHVNVLERAHSPYKEGENEYIDEDDIYVTYAQLKFARLCREDEIPLEFRKQHYELY